MERENLRVFPVSKLEGMRVKNFQGEDVGKIESVMIDVFSGRIAFAVLSFGGIMGIGEKHFAVPWASLTVDADQEIIQMDVHLDLLKKAPGFDKENTPNTPNGLWYREVYDFYHVPPYWTQQNEQGKP
jgi:sporulation protein YlmC with PRC-barrel domain